jgi:hypothetical protein
MIVNGCFIHPGVIVTTFDRSLRLAGYLSLNLDDMDVLPHKLKRIHGTDVYVIASGKNITFIKITGFSQFTNSHTKVKV